MWKAIRAVLSIPTVRGLVLVAALTLASATRERFRRRPPEDE